MNTPERFQDAEEKLNAFTMLVQVLKDDKSEIEDDCALAINHQDFDDLIQEIHDINDEIDELNNTIEELQSFLAVGYPLCLTTNASMVKN
tara:strand:- start:1722 stop:1991 length:270 start_codon:yes stop_codon:yes gene_type:complete